MASKIGEIVLPVVEERLDVGKRTVETGRVRVHLTADERPVVVRGELLHGHVEVERRVLDIEVSEVPPVRDEGDTIVVPVVREEIVVTKRLILTEEVRLRRTSTTEDFAETVILKTQRAVVERDTPDTSPAHPEERD